MRVVEPSHFKNKTEPKKTRPKVLHFFILGALVISGFVFLRSNMKNQTIDPAIVKIDKDSRESQDVLLDDDLLPGEIRTFSGNEFKIFYDNLLQPNLDKVDVPPSISGNDIADARIREIAERRGYRLRSSPTVTLPTLDGYQLQEVVHQPWKQLKSVAKRDGIPISIVSAYRSVENQRQLFLSRLSAEGVDIRAVEKGTADAEVDTVLITSSIPGYSKHHTGYTVDFLCSGYVFENFANTPCNEWITADNYRIAKEFGFIPSYPPDADLQGPAPEAWEYVWVGSDLLIKQ